MGVDRRALLSAGLVAASLVPAAAGESLPEYEAVQDLQGNLIAVGSDSMANLLAMWIQGFRALYPKVTVDHRGKGAMTSPPALIAGTIDLGLMGRPMKDQEIHRFVEKHGHEPTAYVVAIQAIEVIVHGDNPLEKLSLPHVDAIFSTGRRGGHREDITRWGQLGLGGDFAGARIVLYGRNSASGHYGFFKEDALFRGDYKETVREQPGSSAIAEGVSRDRFAIGYAGFGYATERVRRVPLSRDGRSAALRATRESCQSGEYPLSRPLYIYVNKPPGKKLLPLLREFLLFTQSARGQELVAKDVLIPVPADLAGRQRRSIAGTDF